MLQPIYEGQETYYMNAKGHIQCHQHQEKIKASEPQALPKSRSNPIYLETDTIKVNCVEDLLRLYPKSFDRLGSLKGKYDINVNPYVSPIQNARKKVPTESKQTTEDAIFTSYVLRPCLAWPVISFLTL